MLLFQRNISLMLNKKIDYFTFLSLKHAFNIYVDEEKLLRKSLKTINAKANSDYDDEMEWLHIKSLEHANNLYN